MLQRQEHKCENQSNCESVNFAAATLVPEMTKQKTKIQILINIINEKVVLVLESRFPAAVVHANAIKMLHKRTIGIQQIRIPLNMYPRAVWSNVKAVHELKDYSSNEKKIVNSPHRALVSGNEVCLKKSEKEIKREV